MLQMVRQFSVLPCQSVSTTPIIAMGCWQCLPLSVVQLKGKLCQKTNYRNGVIDTFGPCLFPSFS